MAKQLGEFKSRHDPDQEVEHLRTRVKELEGLIRAERDATGEARLVTLALTDAIKAAQPYRSEYKPAKATAGSPITHVLQLTDLHEGEITKRDEVDGFNEFNPDIFTRRIGALGRSVVNVTQRLRNGYSVPKLHILGTADYISGDIHDELKVTNAYPAPVQAVQCGYKLGELVHALAPHFAQVDVDMITLDNHGRMTRKNQAAQGGENNWGYVVAHIVKQYTSRVSNVDVRIHAKASALVGVGPERYLLFHGHQIKGWAGLPYYGFDRRVAMEAVKRMGVPETAFTKMVMGHFHVAVDAPNWLIGGSLSGTNAFDHSCGRHSRAHQTSWLVHPTHGQFHWTRWWL